MRTVVILSGAGLSADSGIPTFRGEDGLWENHSIEDVASQKGWWRNKELVLNFYRDRFNQYRSCEPHAGHHAIAKLQEKFNVINITRNVDDLLERAGCKDVRHIHGTMSKRKCELHKDIESKTRYTKFTCGYKEDQQEPPKLGDLCPACGSQMRPDVVFFGEAVEHSLEDTRELCKEVKYNDGVFICVGTSLEVAPVSFMVPFFSQVKNKYIVDLHPRKIADYTLVEGKACDVLPKLMEDL